MDALQDVLGDYPAWWSRVAGRYTVVLSRPPRP